MHIFDRVGSKRTHIVRGAPDVVPHDPYIVNCGPGQSKCQLCEVTIWNNQKNWVTHSKSKKHQRLKDEREANGT